MTGIYKEKLIFDPENLDCSDNIGSWIRDGYNGNLIGSTENLDGDGYLLNIAVFGADGEGVTTTTEDGYTGLDVYIMNQEPLDVNVTFPASIDVNVLNSDEVDGYWYQEGSVFNNGVDYGNLVLAVNQDGYYQNLLLSDDGYLLVDFARPIAVTLDEPVQVDVDIDAYFYQEDSVHVSSDWGDFVLAVRHDANTPLADDGDYIPFVTDGYNQLKVVADFKGDFISPDGYLMVELADQQIDIDADLTATAVGCSALATSVSDGDDVELVTDLFRRLYVNDSPNIGLASSQISITDTAAVLVSSALPSRRRIMIQNTSNCAIYIGDDNAVTVGNGLRVPGGSTLVLEAGPCLSPYAISESGKTSDIRILEIG